MMLPVQLEATSGWQWQAAVAHLQRVEMARWVLDEHGYLLPAVTMLGVMTGDNVVGHITLKKQPLVCPPLPAGEESAIPLLDSSGEAREEMFVQTFAVEAAYRRQGHGERLQIAALELTRARGCYQMRSWSSLDKSANYALKFKLGFAAHPALYESADGLKISGVYFIKGV